VRGPTVTRYITSDVFVRGACVIRYLRHSCTNIAVGTSDCQLRVVEWALVCNRPDGWNAGWDSL